MPRGVTYIGQPCYTCGANIYYVSVRRCVSCNRIRRKHRYWSNPEKYRAEKAAWVKANPEKVRLYSSESYATDPEKFCNKVGVYRLLNYDTIRIRESIWRKRHRDRVNYWSATREARKRGATPKWLTKNQISEMKDLYYLAKILNSHVDHMEPLLGEFVCGLHVPWNLQILSASENIQKSNMPYQEWIDKCQFSN
jgi:hypothetical protein